MRTVFGIAALTLLLFSTSLLFITQSCRSQVIGAIYITSNGSVEPSTAPIQQVGNTYTFRGDIIGNITIQRDDIILDGAGYSLQETENALESTIVTIGIDLTDRNNVTIKNLQLNNFVNGILLFNSSQNNIIENIIAENVDGVRLDSSTNNNIVGNNITTNFHGVHPSFENNFYHNNFINNTEHVKILPTDSVNTWDNDYPSAGNFWDNYTGQDNNGDGIGDSAHVINSDNVDRYPLMELYVSQPAQQTDQTIFYVAIGLIIVIVVVIIGFLITKKR